MNTTGAALQFQLKMGLTPAYLLGGEFAIRLLLYIVIYLAALLVESFARRRYGSRTAFFATLAFLSTPYLVVTTTRVLIDNFSLLSSTIVFIHCLETLRRPRRQDFPLYFLFMAFAFFYKQLALLFFLPTFSIMFYVAVKKAMESKHHRSIVHFVMGFLLLLALLSPLMIHNYIISSNPVYPLLNEYFQSPYFPLTNFDGNRDTVWNSPLNLRTIYEITFNGSSFMEGSDHIFGLTYFIFFWFLPLLLVINPNVTFF